MPIQEFLRANFTSQSFSLTGIKALALMICGYDSEKFLASSLNVAIFDKTLNIHVM
jgi:hypothetical protein